MDPRQVLEWELHAPGSHIAFRARREDTGYDLVVTRNDRLVLSDVASDSASLLRKSRDLRLQLQRLGYAADAVRQPQPPAGAGRPLQYSMVAALA